MQRIHESIIGAAERGQPVGRESLIYGAGKIRSSPATINEFGRLKFSAVRAHLKKLRLY
jgi:hypothetical protein